MGCTIISKRTLKLPEGHKLMRSVLVEGEAYFPNGAKLMLDYVSTGSDVYVLAHKKTPDGKKWRGAKKWDMESVKNRTAPDLATFAKKLDIRETPGAILAKLIEAKFKEIKQEA